MTVIGGNGDEDATIPNLSVGMTNFTWNSRRWKITGVSYTGNYQSKKMYQISFERWMHFPSQS